uniref:Reverse transcriptase Ty1/copia-type domain-containing protein n=1 Tax=Tanacetum cinerariifolium TaxID=118510 RepID=A0A6L2N2I4_TANCI|nr:hypothetical protein [Tanacetum cinerariifolium]
MRIDDYSTSNAPVIRAAVRVSDPKLKTLSERGIECILVGYDEHSKAFRFYVIEPNDSVAINSIIESRDAIFDEQRFSSVPRPSQRSLVKGTEDSGGLVVSERVTDEIDDPKTFDEAIKSQDVALWINDEMDSIMRNNTWVLTDLPPGCKPLCCKWIFKRKLKVDGTVEKFKARLIDVKTTFLNGEPEKEVYMNQPLGFIMPGNEHKVCKLIKSLYGLKQAPKQWHPKFDEVILSNGYLLNQAKNCLYSKFDASAKGVIICLYIDDMLIFGTDQVQVDLTKEFLSSRFSMKDMEEPYVIFGIRIKHESNGIAISQSHYIEKVLKKFNYFDCTLVSTPLDTCEKPMPNRGLAVSQLEYSKVIGCLMYSMTCTRPDIAFAVEKLSRLVYSGYPSVLEVAGKEAEWLKNLLLDIPLWVKPIAPISIRCNSATTLAKAYSQMYNGKSRHLGVRHSMIHELITNGMVSIEIVRSQQNLADHLTKGLARDLVIKSAEGMGLKVLPPQGSWTLGLKTFMNWIWTHGYVIVSEAFKCLKTCVYLPSDIRFVFIQYKTRLRRRFESIKTNKSLDPIMLRDIEENDECTIPTESELQDFVNAEMTMMRSISVGGGLEEEVNALDDLDSDAEPVGFVNSLPEKWLTLSQGLNANHTQTLDLADIYESQAEPKIQKDYKAEYKKTKAKLALLEANPSTSQTPKTFQPKNKGLVAESFKWNEKEVSDDEEVTQVKEDHRTSDHEMYIASLKRSENYKAQPYQNYPECEIYGSYDHFTSGHNRVIHIRGGVLGESYQSSKSSIGVKCNTCGSTVYSTNDHNEFDHFKRENNVPEVIAPNEHETPHTEDAEVPDVPQFHISNQASTSSNLVPLDRWSKDQHIELVNISINLGEGMLTRSMTAKLTPASASECLFVDFLSEIEPKKVMESSNNQNKGEGFTSSINKDALDANMEENASQPFVVRTNFGFSTCDVKSMYVLPTEGNGDAIVFNIILNVLNIAKIFGISFKTFTDIEDLMTRIEMGKHEAVWLGMTEERCKDVMDSMFTTWKRLMDDNPSVVSNVYVDKTREPSHEYPIVQAVDINLKTTSYARAASTSAKDQLKVNSNFHPLVADPVFNDVNIPIPCKFIEKVNLEADLVDVVTIGILLLTGDGFTKETIRVDPPISTTSNVVTPIIEKTNDSFQMVGKKKMRKGKSKSTNGGQFAGPSVKQIVRYEANTNISAPKKGATNMEKDKEEDVENVYDKSANLFNTKTGGSSSFTVVAGSKWVFRNKKDKHGITIKNKVRLVAQGYSQEEEIDYDETFTPVARMEAIKIFLTFATYMNFTVFQMDVKSAFLNGKLKEEIYVKQPHVFKSSEFPNYVCKLDKALYGLKQAPRACPMCKILDQSKGITSNYCEKNPQVPERKSTSGACQILGGKLVCWSAKKQQYVAMSSVAAEYVAAARCCASIVWMKYQLSNYDIHYKMVPIFWDNTSAIDISNNSVLHSRTKHIDIREFWCTAFATHPNPPTDDFKVHPLKEYTIKFLMMNGKNPLTLHFKTLIEFTGLDYAKDAYVSHPSHEVVKAELAEIVENPILSDRTPILKIAFPMGWRILFTFVIQDESFRISPTIISNSNYSKDPSKVTPVKLITFMSQGLEASESLSQKRKKSKFKKPSTKTKSDKEEVFVARDDMEKDTQADEEANQSSSPIKDKLEPSHILETQVSDFESSSPDLKKYDNIIPLTERQLVRYLKKVSRVLFKKLTNEQCGQHKEVVFSYADLMSSIKGYYEENVDHGEQTNKFIDAAMNSLDKNSIARGGILNALNGVTETPKPFRMLLKKIMYLTRKRENVTHDATEKPPSHTEGETEDMETKNKEEKPKEPKMAVPVSSVKPIETPTPKVQPITIIITYQPKISQAPKRVDKGNKIATDDVEPQVKLVPASRVVREDPGEPVRKATEQARLLAITKPEVVKVVRKEAEKIGINHERITSAKEGEMFKKAQDDELKVLNKEKSKKHRKHKFENYRRYKKIKKIPKELKIQSTLPAPILEQASSKSSKRKRKHMELEPEVKVPGLDCDKSLPESVPFVNNMVIEELKFSSVIPSNGLNDQDPRECQVLPEAKKVDC